MKENWVRGKMGVGGGGGGIEYDPIWFLICIFYFITPPLSFPCSKGQTWHAFNCDLSNQGSTKVVSSLEHLTVHLTGTDSRYGPNSQMRGENTRYQTS